MYNEEKGQLLITALQDGLVEKIGSIIKDLKQSGDLSEYTSEIKEQLNEAIENGRVEVIEHLLEHEEVHGIFIDEYNNVLERARDKLEELEELDESVDEELINKDELIENTQKIINRLIREPIILQAELDRLSKAVMDDDEFMLSKTLKGLPDSIVLSKNEKGLNALHSAMESHSTEMVEALLADERFQKALADKDIYGRTAYDIAKANDFDEGLAAIARISDGANLAKSQLEIKFNDLSQDKINEKLTTFLNKLGRDGKSIIDNEGNCNGWAFLYLIKTSAGNEQEFFDILNTIAECDLSAESLASNDLPETLKNKYHDKADLLEQVCNDLAIFHFASEATTELNLGWGQKSRNEQYELVRDPVNGRELKNLFNYSGAVNKLQLVEMLEYFSRWPDTCVDVGGGFHATSIYITTDKKFKYYDPNHKNKVATFETAEALADHLISFKYKQLDKLNSDQTVDIILRSNKFYPKSAVIPEIEVPVAEQNPNIRSYNKLTDLHFAVLESDITKVKAIIASNPSAMNTVDAHGSTPLHLAIQNERAGKEIVGFLLKSREIDINKGNKLGVTPLMMAINNGDKQLFNVLIQRTDLDLKKVDSRGNNVVTYASYRGDIEMLTSLLKFSDIDVNAKNKFNDTVLMSAVRTGNYAVIDAILTYGKNVNIDEKDSFGDTALLMAAQNGYHQIVERLLKAGADINFNNEGETVFDYAKRSRNPKVTQALVKFKEESALKLSAKREPVQNSNQNTRVKAMVFSQARTTVNNDLAASIIADNKNHPKFKA